jgi:hypothetical protein
MKIKHRSALKGVKSVDLILISVARAFATYLCYMSLRKSETAFFESLFRVPFIEVAQAYNWEYECEFKLQRLSSAKKGALKKIDYGLGYNTQIVGIETKFVKKMHGLTVDLKKDINKLQKLFPKDPRVKPFSRRYAFIVVVAPGDIFKSLKLKGIPEVNEIDEDRLKDFGKKKNIFTSWDSFVTSSRVGKKEYYVRTVKIPIA